MIKHFVLAVLTIMITSFGVQSQNLFPDSGDVLLKGWGIKIERPSTTGGWARGTFLYDRGNTSTPIAGYGLLGTADNINHLYLAHGAAPWASNLGLYIKPNGSVGIGTTLPSSKLDILAQATSSESFVRLKTTDAPNDYFLIGNATSVDGQFIPSIRGKHTSTNIITLINPTA